MQLLEIQKQRLKHHSTFLESILKATGHDIVLNDGVLVGRLAPAIDRELGTIKIKKNRGNI